MISESQAHCIFIQRIQNLAWKHLLFSFFITMTKYTRGITFYRSESKWEKEWFLLKTWQDIDATINPHGRIAISGYSVVQLEVNQRHSLRKPKLFELIAKLFWWNLPRLREDLWHHCFISFYLNGRRQITKFGLFVIERNSLASMTQHKASVASGMISSILALKKTLIWVVDLLLKRGVYCSSWCLLWFFKVVLEWAVNNEHHKRQ